MRWITSCSSDTTFDGLVRSAGGGFLTTRLEWDDGRGACGIFGTGVAVGDGARVVWGMAAGAGVFSEVAC
jgi:hypothetical protein